MAVSTFYGDVFTYMLDQHTNTWVGNGNLSVPSAFYPSLHLDKDILAITFTNPWNHPDVCGVVYKLSTTATNINNGNVVTTTITDNYSGNVVWKEIARLTTKGDPLTRENQWHSGISVKDKVVFIGRVDEGFGKVFVHGLKYINN